MERGLSWDLYIYVFFILFEMGWNGSWNILIILVVCIYGRFSELIKF